MAGCGLRGSSSSRGVETVLLGGVAEALVWHSRCCGGWSAMRCDGIGRFAIGLG